MARFYLFCYVCVAIFSFICMKTYSLRTFKEKDLEMYRNKVMKMFQHAYDNYLNCAFPYDELQPISCSGMDTWGSFSLTLIDALDTLVVMQNYSEFRRVVHALLSTADFNVNINVSVFETNIRVVGGLLSAHLLSKRAGLDTDPGWPCSGPLLNLAEKVARRLLPAFDTETGMPYGTVNLRYGVPIGETPITCTAGVSTFILEFGTLSQLTGDPVFEKVAVKALDALWKRRSALGLVGNHINVQDGKWTALDSGIGGGVDSYFEYLVKGAILFQEPKFLKMFKEYEKLIAKHMKKDDWYFWVSMGNGQISMPTFQSLEAFWPGLLSLVGDIEQALKTLFNYHQVWKQYGFTPEIYDVTHSHAKRESYPLRPELVESVMYLYYATKDHRLLEIAVDILESIEYSAKTDCGYATIKNVADHKTEDRMESFFLAETTKYLYLLFDPENFMHNSGSCGTIVQMTGGNCVLETGGFIFNTEAHPIDIAAVYCCSVKHKDHEMLLYNFQRTMDLHSLLEITERDDFFQVFKQSEQYNLKLKKNFLRSDPSVNKQETLDTQHSKASILFNNPSINISDTLIIDSDQFNSLNSNLRRQNNDHISVYKNLTDRDKEEVSFIDSFKLDNVLSEDITSEDITSLPLFSKHRTNPNASSSKNILESPLFAELSDNEPDLIADDACNEEYCTFELLTCPAQPYIARFNIMGEMFNT